MKAARPRRAGAFSRKEKILACKRQAGGRLSPSSSNGEGALVNVGTPVRLYLERGQQAGRGRSSIPLAHILIPAPETGTVAGALTGAKRSGVLTCGRPRGAILKERLLEMEDAPQKRAAGTT